MTPPLEKPGAESIAPETRFISLGAPLIKAPVARAGIGSGGQVQCKATNSTAEACARGQFHGLSPIQSPRDYYCTVTLNWIGVWVTDPALALTVT